MRWFLLLVMAASLMVAGIGCREKTTQEKMEDAVESAQEDAEDMKEEAEKKLDEVAK